MFSLWRKARRENSAASRLLGTTSLRFALHSWQRVMTSPSAMMAVFFGNFSADSNSPSCSRRCGRKISMFSLVMKY
ncbi:hypothetical protein, partial [Thiolapillus sp.]|uniref:hypothetical protein n=1 Tax=Thiolapillus sp. TaxID=2017437 RepID=UPI0025E097B6